MIRIGQARRPIREKAADLKGEVCATRWCIIRTLEAKKVTPLSESEKRT